MILNYKLYGEGAPLIILHGLLGTMDNWGGQIKRLSQHFQVISVDLRNHGRSPHSDEMSYALMAEDIVELIDHLGFSKVSVIGHSMGGKTAMQLALNYPKLIDKLIIVDISPIQYPPHHANVFEGLYAIDLANLASRSDANKQLAQHVDDPGTRAFLLKNLYRTEDNKFAWLMNLDALHNQYNNICAAPDGKPFESEVLFIKGELSDYMLPAHRDAVLKLFPHANYKVVMGSGHNPHAEKPAEFSKLALTYLTRPDI
ncbi:alpha/beta fold hydrolase [Neptuniibacter sp. 1_MG-2023]|uniref:alpha/beta fold hydrolase n=1 Tax=Neptuniibacter sp. 1_MG-2023 TaxID=3062662 RepID=UPI0026E35B5D|nr:alpha/beta fold hydrolase [Neptuniibacter sp. 1_MG-2023]MDO6592850.1 alpha/beta fold hydrolase [Neptuniibacter sp. 1_MG-2023]